MSPSPSDHRRPSRRRRVVALGIAGTVLAVVVVYWAVVVRDTSSPSASLDALASNTQGTAAPGGSPDGHWVVQPGPDVFVGYRVKETLLPARNTRTVNGRTAAVTGTMTVSDGHASDVTITVDLTKLDSGEPLREKAMQSIALETERFPTATFTVQAPIDLPAVSTGSTVDVTAHGQLTAHGTTHAIDVPLQARWNGNQIALATVGDGAAVVFADWGITLPKLPISEDDDHGTIEVQLSFVRG